MSNALESISKHYGLEADVRKLQSTVESILVEMENVKKELSILKGCNTKKTTKVNPFVSNSVTVKTIDSPIKHLDEDIIQQYKERAKKKQASNNNETDKHNEICSKCKESFDVKVMCKIFDKRQGISYECVDTKECYKRANADKIVTESKLEQYRHLPKEEQLKSMYGVDFSDLEEIPFRTRDASIHYNYFPKKEGEDGKGEDGKGLKRFKWCWASKTWSCRNVNVLNSDDW